MAAHASYSQEIIEARVEKTGADAALAAPVTT